ncbi:unnamed protein product, partial [Protopolystoma xenopodis]
MINLISLHVNHTREALESVHADFLERRYRWSAIEQLLGRPRLIPTPGLAILRAYLQPYYLHNFTAAAANSTPLSSPQTAGNESTDSGVCVGSNVIGAPTSKLCLTSVAG